MNIEECEFQIYAYVPWEVAYLYNHKHVDVYTLITPDVWRWLLPIWHVGLRV